MKRSTRFVFSSHFFVLVGLYLPLHADWVTTSVHVGTVPQAVAVNPVTNKIYVANYSRQHRDGDRRGDERYHHGGRR